MTKDLVVISKMFGDFRADLIEHYQKKKSIIEAPNFHVLRNKIIVEGKAIDPFNTLIFVKEGSMIAFSEDFMLKYSGFEVDSPSYSSQLTSRKEVLLSFLRQFGYKVPDLYIREIPQADYSIRYTNNETFGMEVLESKEVQGETVRFNVMVPWDNKFIDGRVFYFYLNNLVCSGYIHIESQRDISIKLTTPDVKYMRVRKADIATFRPEFSSLGVPTEVRLKLDKNLVGSQTAEILKIPKLIGSASCEIITGFNTLGEEYILNIETGHEPISGVVCDKTGNSEFFAKQLMKAFDKVVGFE